MLRCHPNAAIFRYPYVYGPYQLVPREWSVVRRILDRRKFILLPNDGLALMTHGYAENLAHAVLLAVDQPEASYGQAYNCGDEIQFTMRQLVEVIARDDEPSTGDNQRSGGLPLRAGRNDPVHHGMVDIFKLKASVGLSRRCRARLKRCDEPSDGIWTIRWNVAATWNSGCWTHLTMSPRIGWRTSPGSITSKMAAVEVRKPGPSAHPYPHPKEPGLQRDHRNR